MSGRAEQPRPETAPKQPLRREIPSFAVVRADVEQMAAVIGGEAKSRDEDFLDVPYLVHPLGITVRFGEAFTDSNPDENTTVSIAPTLPGGPAHSFEAGAITIEDGIVIIFKDEVVIRQHSQIMVNGGREDIIDEVTLTKEDYNHTRELDY
jgi:hypothetical protein